MNWNNEARLRKLKKELETIQKIFAEENLPIELYKEYEKLLLSQHNSDRRYAAHTQEFLLSKFEDESEDESESALYGKFEAQLITTIEQSIHNSRYWWVEEIDDYELAYKIKQLSMDDIELIRRGGGVYAGKSAGSIKVCHVALRGKTTNMIRGM